MAHIALMHESFSWPPTGRDSWARYAQHSPGVAGARLVVVASGSGLWVLRFGIPRSGFRILRSGLGS